jgi:hypothetical protein
MAKWSRKVWIGIGAASLVGVAGTRLADAQHEKTQTTAPPAAGKDTGGMASGGMAAPQAGEAYLTDEGPRDTRIRIYRDIALMRGHLLVGAALIEQELWEEALPHFLHPTEELYGHMERYIKLHKITPFDHQLKAQGQAVKAKNKAAYRQAAKVVDERLTDALNAFKRFMTEQPFTSYTARTAVEVVKVAQSEYEASIEDGRFTKPVEYQDSRGFVSYAARMLEGQADDFRKIDAARFDELLRLLEDLKRAWPAPLPPEKPILEAQAVSAKVGAVEKAAARFF